MKLCSFRMSFLFLSNLFTLGFVVTLTFFRFNFSVASSPYISTTNLSQSSCPLNFNVLQKLVSEGSVGPAFIDVITQCQFMLEGIRMVRSEYLRTNGYFLTLPNASEACWHSYQILARELIPGFDIKSACGYHPEWISEGCMNITSRSQFESLISRSNLQDVWQHCNQSLASHSSCESCTNVLLNLSTSYLHFPQIGDVSNCSALPFIYAGAVVNEFGPTDVSTAKCLFRLEFSLPTPRVEQHLILISGVLIGCIVGFFGAFSAVWILWRRHKNPGSEEKNFATDKTDETSLVLELGGMSGSANLVKFNIEEIKEATMNFSRENMIGKGGYGNVYKGVLPDGSEVALKRFKNCSAAGSATFAHEVEVIASVRHVNLVALRGYCTATVPLGGHQRILVCDLMRNGSLYDHLFGSGMKKLSWPVRKKIALGTARGLAYLHYGVQPAIIHRDIKASNILLDESFEPKVADFGLAKFNAAGRTHLSTRMAGTLGYVAPEYALYGKLTERSDVYSFGVVLLELLSARMAFENNEGKTSLLTDWAWELVQKGRALAVIEEGMEELELPEEMEQYVLVGVLCSHPILQARPTMDQIVKILEIDRPACSLET